MKINWRSVSDLLLQRQTILSEIGRTQSILDELEKRYKQAISPDLTITDLQEIFVDEQNRLFEELDRVDGILRSMHGEVAQNLAQHNRFIELWRRSLLLNQRR